MPSNHPAKKAQAKKKVSSAADFRKASKRGNHELELPSGNVCLVRRPGLPELLGANVLPDSLSPIADRAIKEGQSGHEMTDEEIKGEMEQLVKNGQAMDIFDAAMLVVAHCVVEPKTRYHKRPTGEFDDKGRRIMEDIPDEERDEEYLYTDEVDLEDQMFIFSYVVGGSSDLEQFRAQFSAGLGGVSAG